MDKIVGVILAGGLARRMGGGDKCLQPLGKSTLLEVAIERARPQVDQLLLNANGDLARFDPFDLPKATDIVDGYAGPLAGILTAMSWARENHPEAEWVLSIASDTPFYPGDLAQRLLAQATADKALIAVAESGERIHPVFGLWHLSLMEDLRKSLVEEDTRKIFRWMKQHPWTQVSFDVTENGIDPFFNVNSPQELKQAQALFTVE